MLSLQVEEKRRETLGEPLVSSETRGEKNFHASDENIAPLTFA